MLSEDFIPPPHPTPTRPFQGKGYMKTYWLKGKKDLSFKTPAELRYSGKQKDSEDISSNG